MGKIIMALEAPPLVTRDESSSSAFGKTTQPLHQQTTASTTRSSSSGSRRQRVSFGSDDTPVKAVVHSYSYCDDDDDNDDDNEASNDTDDSSSNATWYSNQEFQEMRRETYAKIKLYRHHYFHNDHDDEDDDWTWRGFEYVITRHPRKHLRREHVINVVYFQKVLGTMTETAAIALADYASNMTFANGSAFRARSLAIRDEMEACSGETQQSENEETSSTSSSCSSLVVVDAPKTIPMSTGTRGKPSSQRHSSTHSHGSTVGPASPWIKMRQFFRCI